MCRSLLKNVILKFIMHNNTAEVLLRPQSYSHGRCRWQTFEVCLRPVYRSVSNHPRSLVCSTCYHVIMTAKILWTGRLEYRKAIKKYMLQGGSVTTWLRCWKSPYTDFFHYTTRYSRPT